MENMLRVGVITSVHGIEGEVKVSLTTDDAKCSKKLKGIILNTGKEHIPMKIEHVKFFKDMVTLRFGGYDNINEIEKYESRDLLITRDQAVDLKPDEYFIMDPIGLTMVSDRDTELRTLKDVLETGADDVCVVAMKDGKELMLPAIGDHILNANLEQGRMEVHILEGLMDLQCP